MGGPVTAQGQQELTVSKPTSSRRRIRASTLAAAALAGGVTMATAQPASAEGSHWCPSDVFPWADDSALVDPLHHNVEPLLPALHGTNCQLQGALNQYSCYLPVLAPLIRGPQTYPLC